MTVLTLEQQQVIAHAQGHARVVAVAGAGKTTTLTHFIKARLQEGVAPRRMLVLMYNRAAREDFEAKLARLLPAHTLPEVRTFHSLGLRIYQRLITQGVLPAYVGKPLSDGEMEPVVWRMLQQLADDDTKQDILSQRKKWVEPALGFIDLVKAGLASPHDVFESLDLPDQCRIFIDLFDLFEDWRKRERRISYSDMLYDPVMAFVYQPEIAAQFGGHMQWILVDEYQDINEIQQKLLDVLYGGRGSVMVIGDPDQTIYEFRGSKPEFIVSEFDKQMQQVSIYQLPHTFRYGHSLALLANHLITHNKERDSVLCLAHSSTPKTRIKLHQARFEPALALALIKSEAEKRPLHDIAIINRLWALCAPIELGLLQAGIPYQLHNSQSVLDRFELQIFWTLFEIAAGQFHLRAANTRQDIWLQILTTPYPKIKRSLLENMAAKLAHAEQDYAEAMLAAIPDELNKWQRSALEARAEIVGNAEHMNMPAYLLARQYINRTNLHDGIADSAFSAQQIEDRLQTIEAFVRFLKDSEQTSRDAYGYLSVLKQQRLEQSKHKNDGVHLTSIHKSKGLEWPVVIIPGVNAHYYPYAPEGDFTTTSSEESERRLLYVAMTRAKHELHLLAPDPLAHKEKTATERDWISKFQKELNVARSSSVGEAINQQKNAVELSPLDGSIAAWLPTYLERVQHPLTFTMAAMSENKADKYANRSSTISKAPKNAIIASKFSQGKSEVLRHVEHQSMGRGAVVFEDERYIKIRFSGEDQARTFIKDKVASLLRNT